MFDPYHKWLGIPPKDQPPHHYRLLAIDLFESDADVIDAAANRQMAYVQQRAMGEHQGDSQRLLNELSAARVCLLNPQKKRAYDAKLREQLGDQPEATGAGPPADPLAFLESGAPPLRRPAKERAGAAPLPAFLESGLPPLPVPAEEQPATAPPLPAFLESGAPPLPTEAVESPVIVPTRSPIRSAKYRRRSQGSQQFLKFFLIAAGCVAALLVALIMFILSNDTQKPLAGAEKTSADVAKTEKKREVPIVPSHDLPQPKPAIYNVQIDPPFATLEVKGDRGTTSGDGRLRQIRIDDPSQSVLIVASCDGYKSSEQFLEPKPGENANLRIVLEKLPQEKPNLPPKRSPAPAAPKEPDWPPRASSVLAGAVFAMNFDVDDHGVMPFVGFNHNTYTAEGRGAVSIDGKVGKGLRLSNGSFLAIRGKFPTAQQPRTVSVWLKATQGKQEQGYALVYGDSRGNGQIFSIQIIRGSWCFSPHGGVAPVDTHVAVDAAWHHHCLVYDGKALIYTIDAEPVSPVPIRLNTSAGEMCLGGLFGSRTPFSGDVRRADRIRSRPDGHGDPATLRDG